MRSSFRYEEIPKLMDLIRDIPEIAKEHPTVLFLIDGFGTRELGLRSLKRHLYRTVFPSSTPTFQYSFHSLKDPHQHGYLEWYARVEVYGEELIMEIPPWHVAYPESVEVDEKILKRRVFPFKPLSQMLYEMGLKACYYTPYPDSIFTRMTCKHAEIVGIKQLSEVFPLREADFSLIYWDGVDRILHKSFDNDAMTVERAMIKVFVKHLWKKMPEGSELIILSDHGLIKTTHKIKLPEVDGCVPVGGSRVAFYKDTTVDTVSKALKPQDKYVEICALSELFEGRISRRCYRMYGNVVVIADNNARFVYPFERQKSAELIGAHGGISREEMLVHVWCGKKRK